MYLLNSLNTNYFTNNYIPNSNLKIAIRNFILATKSPTLEIEHQDRLRINYKRLMLRFTVISE